jgi:hypothetical protein
MRFGKEFLQEAIRTMRRCESTEGYVTAIHYWESHAGRWPRRLGTRNIEDALCPAARYVFIVDSAHGRASQLNYAAVDLRRLWR